MAWFDAVRAACPPSIPWLLLGVSVPLGLAAVLAFGAARGIPGELHWTERARRIAPIRAELGLAVAVVGLVVPCGARADDAASTALLVACALSAALALRTFVEARLVGRPTSLAEAVLRTLAGLVVRVDALVPWVAFALVPARFGIRTTLVVAGASAVVLAWSFVGPRLARVLGLLHDAPPRVRALLARLPGEGAERVRATWVVPSHLAQALAVPDHGALVLSTRALAVLGDDELVALLAHEAEHLDEPRRVHELRRLATLSFLPLLFARPLGHALGLVGLGLALAAWLALAGSIARALRSLEERADAAGASVDAAAYARALEALHRTNLLPAVDAFASPTHPSLYDRMLAVGVAPSYARPAPPVALGARVGAWALFAVVLACAATLAPAHRAGPGPVATAGAIDRASEP